MNFTALRRPLWLLASVLALTVCGTAAAEPPERAARLGFIEGSVSLSPGGDDDWVRAPYNRPLTTGDRLWVGRNSRAEVQFGGAALRIGDESSLQLLNLDNRMAQLQLTQGTLIVRVRSLAPGQLFEVNTPNLALTLRRPGEYRIEVDPSDDATAVTVFNGAAEAYGDGASYAIRSGRGYRFYGIGLSDYETFTARSDDALGRWARLRDRRGEGSASARWVSPEVVGYEDLDEHGSWRRHAEHGYVWYPSRVTAGWSPYRDGHWAWIDPWGWTWIDDAPWGYAVSHYGRWAHLGGSWAWVPGPRQQRAVYAPALVAFVAGSGFQASISVGGASPGIVGWFPLAPREVYQPSYTASRRYFDNINRSNAVVAPATLTTVYNTYQTTIINRTTVVNLPAGRYANQRVGGAVVAVPTTAFVQAQPVAKATVAVSRETVAAAPVTPLAAVAPVQKSVRGNAAETNARPPARERAVVAKTAPPPPAVPFAAQQPQLASRQGVPIDDTERRRLKPQTPAVAAPKVAVVTPTEATPTAPPPAVAPAPRTRDQRAAGRDDDDRGRRAARGNTGTESPAAAAAARAEATAAEAGRVEASRREGAARTEVDRADALKARTEAQAAAAAKAEAARTEAAKAEAAKAEAGKAEAAKAEAAKAEAAKVDREAKSAAAAAEASKRDAMRAEAARVDAAREAAARNDAARGDALKARTEAQAAAAAKAEAAKAEAGRAEAGKAEAARAEAAKVDREAKAAAAAAEASKRDAARAEAARADAAREAAARNEAARADALKARTEAQAAAAAKAEAAKAEAEAKRAARTDGNRSSGRASDAERAPDRARRGQAEPQPAGEQAAAPPPARGRGAAPRDDEEERKKGERGGGRG